MDRTKATITTRQWLRLSVAILIALQGSAGLASRARSDDSADLKTKMTSDGYVAVPLSAEAGKGLRFKAKLHGRELDLAIELSGGSSLFDKRALTDLGVELTKTTKRLPTRRGVHYLYTAKLIGLEFAGKSTPPMNIGVAEVDVVLGRPRADAPDGLISFDMLERFKAVIDVEGKWLYLKPE